MPAQDICDIVHWIGNGMLDTQVTKSSKLLRTILVHWLSWFPNKLYEIHNPRGACNLLSDIATISRTHHQFSSGQKSNNIETTNTMMAENHSRKFDFAHGNSCVETRSNCSAENRFLPAWENPDLAGGIFHPPHWAQELMLEKCNWQSQRKAVNLIQARPANSIVSTKSVCDIKCSIRVHLPWTASAFCTMPWI